MKINLGELLIYEDRDRGYQGWLSVLNVRFGKRAGSLFSISKTKMWRLELLFMFKWKGKF